jgi:hypothetical protein
MANSKAVIDKTGANIAEGQTKRKREFLSDALHIFTLFGFALAQPLFAPLSENATFFVAQYSRPVDIVSLVIFLCVLVPAFFVLLEAAAGLLGLRCRKGFHHFFAACLVAAAALPVLKRLPGAPGIALVALSAALGALFAVAYVRFGKVRFYLTLISPSILLFPALFLFNSPVHKLVFPEKAPLPTHGEIHSDIPVVMVVFDEMPVTSLMDEDRLIDPFRYPNFAALAGDSTWYRNATTVGDGTDLAVPAILTGMYPDPDLLPSSFDYPQNLFTLLGDAYNLNVREHTTHMCPEHLCKSIVSHKFTKRMFFLLTDVAVIYANIIIPKDLYGQLPGIANKWNNFNDDKAGIIDRVVIFKQFTDSIKPNKKPTLNFLHVSFPHRPFKYLPSGKHYTTMMTASLTTWSDDEFAVTMELQHHLLQLGYADKLLGELLEKLKGIDLYDRSLIVVTADHGISFRAGGHPRSISSTTYQDIIPVPLIIKKPFQKAPVVDDRNVESVDILPTLADFLDAKVPWETDGHSMLSPSFTERKMKVAYSKKKKDKFVFGPSIDEKYDTLKRKLNLFGSGSEPDGLYKIGPHKALIGQEAAQAGISGKEGGTVELNQASSYENVDPNAAFVPAQVSGYIEIDRAEDASIDLAIAINGTIRAVTRTFKTASGRKKFSAVVPESIFQAGQNRAEVFVVEEDGGKLSLLPTVSRARRTFAISSSPEGPETITASDGTSLHVVADIIMGHLDHIRVKGNFAEFSGWAADVESSEPPDTMLIFVNGEFLHSGPTNVMRYDVASLLDKESLVKTGFSYFLTSEHFLDTENLELRVFAALKRGVASEIKFNRTIIEVENKGP